MAEGNEAGWIERTFGDEFTGTKWGGVGAVGIGGILGWFMGGPIGAAAGAAGGAFILAPILNELLHKWLGPTMPTLPTAIPVVPVNENLQAHIFQPGGPAVDRVVPAPILSRFVVPPANGVGTAIQLRDQLRNTLVTGNGSETDFSARVREEGALTLNLATFYTNMRTYQTDQRSYQTSTEYTSLIGSVTTLANSYNTRLTPAEITAFVPQLPSADAIFDRYPQFAVGQTIPPIANLYNPANPSNPHYRLDVDTLARNFFTNSNPAQPGTSMRRYFTPERVPAGTLEQWNGKSYIEKMNIALLVLEDRFAAIAYSGGEKLDWSKIGGYKKWTDIVEAEIAKGVDASGEPIGNISQAILAEASRMRRNIPAELTEQTARNQYLLNLQLVEQLAPIMHARETVNHRLRHDFQPLITELSAFRVDQLEPASRNAHDFVNKRIKIFNENQIAVFSNGKIPGTPERFYISYKDCNQPNAPTRTLVGTMIGEQFCVTHRIEGLATVVGNDLHIAPQVGSPASPANWTSSALTTPVVVDRDAFVNLTNGATLRNLISTPSALTAMAETPEHGGVTLLGLIGNFRDSSTEIQGGTNVIEHGQPSSVPRRTVTTVRANSDELTAV